MHRESVVKYLVLHYFNRKSNHAPPCFDLSFLFLSPYPFLLRLDHVELGNDSCCRCFCLSLSLTLSFSIVLVLFCCLNSVQVQALGTSYRFFLVSQLVCFSFHRGCLISLALESQPPRDTWLSNVQHLPPDTDTWLFHFELLTRAIKLLEWIHTYIYIYIHMNICIYICMYFDTGWGEWAKNWMKIFARLSASTSTSSFFLLLRFLPSGIFRCVKSNRKSHAKTLGVTRIFGAALVVVFRHFLRPVGHTSVLQLLLFIYPDPPGLATLSSLYSANIVDTQSLKNIFLVVKCLSRLSSHFCCCTDRRTVA